MATLYKSRRRKLEEALKETFTTFAGTALGSTQIIMGRELSEQEPTHIRIFCDTQERVNDEEEPLLNFRVGGMMMLQLSMDDNTRTAGSDLEGIVEGYLEQTPETITNDLNTSSVSNFGVWDFFVGDSTEEVDEENRRYLMEYTFSAIVAHQTY